DLAAVRGAAHRHLVAAELLAGRPRVRQPVRRRRRAAGARAGLELDERPAVGAGRRAVGGRRATARSTARRAHAQAPRSLTTGPAAQARASLIALRGRPRSLVSADRARP